MNQSGPEQDPQRADNKPAPEQLPSMLALPPRPSDNCLAIACRREHEFGAITEMYSACNIDIGSRGITSGGWVSHQLVRFEPDTAAGPSAVLKGVTSTDPQYAVQSIWTVVGGKIEEGGPARLSFVRSRDYLAAISTPLVKPMHGGELEIICQMRIPPVSGGPCPWDEAVFSFDRHGALRMVISSGLADGSNPHQLSPDVLDLFRGPSPENKLIKTIRHAPDSAEAKMLVREFLGPEFVDRKIDLDLFARRLFNSVKVSSFLPIPQLLKTLPAAA